MSPHSRRVTVRLSPATHAIVEAAAHREGVSFAQYMREAALLRTAWEHGRAEDGDDLAAAVREGFEWVRAEWEELGGFEYEG